MPNMLENILFIIRDFLSFLLVCNSALQLKATYSQGQVPYARGKAVKSRNVKPRV